MVSKVWSQNTSKFAVVILASSAAVRPLLLLTARNLGHCCYVCRDVMVKMKIKSFEKVCGCEWWWSRLGESGLGLYYLWGVGRALLGTSCDATRVSPNFV